MRKKNLLTSNRFGLGTWIFSLTVLLVALAAGVTATATHWLGQKSIVRTVRQELEGAQRVQASLQQQRNRQLELISRVFASDTPLANYLRTATLARSQGEVFTRAAEYQNLLTFDLGMVLDPTGIVLARTDNRDGAGEDLGANPLIAMAQQEKQALGVFRQKDRLYQAVTFPLAQNFERVGFFLAAYELNSALATQIQRSSGAEVVFLTTSANGPVTTTSTLDPGLAAELVETLRRRSDLLGALSRSQKPVEETVLLQGKPWALSSVPLTDAAGQPVGATVALSSLGDKLAPFTTLRWIALSSGLLALAVGFFLAHGVGRHYSRPVRALDRAVAAVGQGNLEAPLPQAASGELGQLTYGLSVLLHDLRSKTALELYLGRVARYLPEPAKTTALARAQTRKVVLCAMEMRRFANPKVGYDAEESLARMRRDLRRVTAAVEAHRGQVEAVAGHRVLAVFSGDGSAFRALTAAAEVLVTLSERENVFDEPEPPAIVLAQGSAVIGSLPWGGKLMNGLLGLPVQQLEGLLREATPGELFLAKQLLAELVEPLRQAGIELRLQRGLLSGLPLAVVTPEQALKLAGERAKTAASAHLGFPGEGRSLAEITPGVVLGERFEILAELGTGPLGTVCKALDRQKDDLVTLKVLRPDVLADPERFARWRQVIQRLHPIRHPHLLSVLDFGEAEGLPYLTWEFVRAMNLRHLIEHGRDVPLVAGLRILRQMAAGLAAAHQEQVIHGGLKPENVLLEARGNVLLMDFGLGSPLRRGLTAVPGVAYLAPEQLVGREADAQSDLYAWGALGYEFLTGKVPVSGENPHEIQLQLAQTVAPPSTLNPAIPPLLDSVLLGCLAQTPEARFATAEELLAALAAVG